MPRTIRLLAIALLLGLSGLMSPAMAAPVRVLMQTSLGDITLELNPDKAPGTVENFLRYVDEGFYAGTIFHRVIYDFMIQGGGFTADYEKKKTHGPIRNEADNGLKNERGTIAMARTPEPNSASSQFFINHKNNTALNFRSKDAQGWGYTVFGTVVSGMEVVDRIAEQPTAARDAAMSDAPKKTVTITAIKRLK